MLVLCAVVVAGGCKDKAEPEYAKCVQADTAGDTQAAREACQSAMKADPTSASGKAAAAKLADLEAKAKVVFAAADEKAAAAFHLWDGDGDAGRKDQSGAQKLFTETCGQGSQLGCTGLAIGDLDGVNGTGKDYKKALALLQPACDAKNGRACSALGSMYANADGVPEDKSKAGDLYKTACDLGEMRGCDRLADLYIAGQGGLPQDRKRGFDLYLKACEGGLPSGCSDVANAYLVGYGVARSRGDACKYAQKACTGNDGDGCAWLAGCYSDGESWPKDKKKSVDIAKMSCERFDSARGCTVWGALLWGGDGVPKSLSAATGALTKACDGNSAEGCLGLATLQRQRGSDYIVVADTAMKKACDLGNATACKEFRR
jgi:TPR repeat protein